MSSYLVKFIGKHYMTDFLALLQLLSSFVNRCLRDHPDFVEDIGTNSFFFFIIVKILY